MPTEGADASGAAGAVAFALSHPAAMCTAIPFDLGAYAEGEGARFDDPTAVTAWLNGEGDTVAETIDGRTGEGTGGTAGVCRVALLRAHRSVAARGEGEDEPVGDAREGGGPPGYRALKEAAGKHSGYAAAKRAAMAQPALWTLSDRHRARRSRLHNLEFVTPLEQTESEDARDYTRIEHTARGDFSREASSAGWGWQFTPRRTASRPSVRASASSSRAPSRSNPASARRPRPNPA